MGPEHLSAPVEVGSGDDFCVGRTEFSSIISDFKVVYRRGTFKGQPWTSDLGMISGSDWTQFSSLISDSEVVYGR